jgi:flavin-dependent dehydrogenase
VSLKKIFLLHNLPTTRTQVKMTSTDDKYDVVVMGGGITGLMLCRLLKLQEETKHLKVACVDPMPIEREDMKVGEALIEWSTCFLERELQMKDYFFENRYPEKQGISFHHVRREVGTSWVPPAEPQNFKQEYWASFAAKGGWLRAWFVDRAKLEKDMIKMNIDMGVPYYQARCSNVQLNNKECEAPYRHTVDLRPNKSVTEVYPKTIQAKYLVDSAGRSFLIGTQINNVVRDVPVKNSASWVRVAGFNRKLAEKYGFYSYDQNGKQLITYFSTNHLCNHGCYTWQIPLDPDVETWSIGVTYFHDLYPDLVLNTEEKLMEFLKEHYFLLYDIIKSGTVQDFKFRANLAFRSKQFYFEDQYSVLGDAAAFLDPFASPGIAMNTYMVSHIADLIKDQLCTVRTPDFDQKLKRKLNAFNRFYDRTYESCLAWFETFGTVLGHAEAMSLNVAIGNEMYFSQYLPIHLARKHLDVEFCEWWVDKHVDKSIKMYRRINQQLYKIRDNKELKKNPVAWEFCFWNVVMLHSTYRKHYDAPEGNGYAEASECDYKRAIELGNMARAISAGQMETDGEGFLKAVTAPLLTNHHKHLNWSDLYYYWMGCVTKSNILAYGLLAVLPVLGPKTSMSRHNIDLLRHVIPSSVYHLYANTVPSLGLAPSMMLTRPSNMEAAKNLIIRSVKELLTVFVLIIALIWVFIRL